MALTRKGTEARDALSAAALRRAAEEDAPKGGRCLQCRPGGRYFKYRPPPGLVRSVRCDVCGRDRSVAGERHPCQGLTESRQLAGGRGASVARKIPTGEIASAVMAAGRVVRARAARQARRNAAPAFSEGLCLPRCRAARAA